MNNDNGQNIRMANNLDKLDFIFLFFRAWNSLLIFKPRFVVQPAGRDRIDSKESYL